MFLGEFWPPKGIESSDPFSLIIFGTAVLLSSSLFVTITHSSFGYNDLNKAFFYFFITLFFGFCFVDVQIVEYASRSLNLVFCINDSVFGGFFIFITSLHASHVMVGLIFLLVSVFLFILGILNNMKIVILDLSIWY